MRRPEVKITEATVRAMREQRVFRSSEGACVTQSFVECGGGIDALAVSDDGRVQNRSYPSAHGGSSGQAGWEFVEALGLDREAPRVGEEAAALLTADACPSGVTTIVVDAEQMVLQVHESVGHPTELDRVYGTEAAYAGTSFLKPGDLGSLRYGSEHMNITADPTTPLGLGTFGWDDEGSPARRQPVVEGGLLTGYLASRETAALIGRPSAAPCADNWSRMPLVRMTNLHLEPGAGTLEDLLDVDDGLYLCTNKSWSIDDKRLNFQFGTQVAWEIKKGKLGKMLRDPTYMGVTPEFWGGSTPWPGPTSGRCSGSRIAARGNRASTRTSHTERRRHASATSRWAFARDSGARARGARREGGGRRGRRLGPRRELRVRPLRGIGGAPTDPDQGRERDASGRPRRPCGLCDDEPRRRRGARRGGRACRRGCRQLPGRPGLRRPPGAGDRAHCRGLRRGDGGPVARGPGRGRRRGDRRRTRPRALRLLHERRHRDRRRVHDRPRRLPGDDRREPLALAASEDSSGYAEATSWRASDLDPAAVAREAAEKAARPAARRRSSRRASARCSSRTRSPSSCSTSPSPR